jgi:hypothetical protein
MPVLPNTRLEQLEWVESHLPLWSPSPTTIGLTSLQITELQNLATAARDSYTAQLSARNAAKNATVAFYSASDSLRDRTGELITTVKAFAENTNNPSVYTTADVPPPAPPSTVPAPAAPTDLVTTVENDGSVTVRWKATQPAPGAQQYFRVYRALNGSPAYAPLSDTGLKEFNDATVPVGTSLVSYQVQARRGDKSSTLSEAVIVRFGVPGGDSMAEGLKLAA